MTRFIVTSLASTLLIAGTAGAQERELVIPDVGTPTLPAKAPTVQGFVPAGWTIESRLDGPIDADAKADAVLLLHNADPRNVLHNDGFGVQELDTNPRLLVVLVADPAGGWRRVAQSDRLIRRNDNPTREDPLEEGSVSLDKRVLAVTVGFFANMGSWSTSRTTYKFRWQDGCMRMVGFDEDSVQRNSGETTDVSVNLLTNKASRTVGSIEDDRTHVRRYTLKSRAPVCLETVNDEFDPGVPGE
ncbi:hypothetical protein [Lysobacter sp. HA18]